MRAVVLLFWIFKCSAVDFTEHGSRGTTVEHYLDLNAFDAAFEHAKAAGEQHVTVAILGSAQSCIFDNFITRLAGLPDFGPVVLAGLDGEAHDICGKLKAKLAMKSLTCVPPLRSSPWFKARPTKQVHYADDYYRTITQFKPELMYIALQHSVPTMLTDIDIIYLQPPWTYFKQKRLGKRALMFQHADDNDTHFVPNTGVCYAEPNWRTRAQAKTWKDAMHHRPPQLTSDQETLWAILGLPGVPAYLPGGGYNKQPPAFKGVPAGSAVDYVPSDKYHVSCVGCGQKGLIASHCTGQCCKTHEMKACPGWWKVTLLDEDKCSYFGVSKGASQLSEKGSCPCNFKAHK